MRLSLVCGLDTPNDPKTEANALFSLNLIFFAFAPDSKETDNS